MVMAAIILTCAWAIGSICQELFTADYVIHLSRNLLTPYWLPLITFITAAIVSFATGTSWGTMAILIPTAIPVAYQLDGGSYNLTTMISLGAILDGAIFGDHCSPISDTTIMSSISSACDHIHHVQTQIPYCLTVSVIAIVCGYIPAALGVPSVIGISAGSVIIILGFLVLKIK